MRQEVKNMAEYLAIGSVSTRQLFEVCNSKEELEEAFEYFQEYSRQYNSDMSMFSAYSIGSIDFEDIVINKKSYDKVKALISYGLLPYNKESIIFKDTSEKMHMLKEVMDVFTGNNISMLLDALKDHSINEIYKEIFNK